MIAVVGAADDLLELSADVKLLGQILAAVIPVAAGVRVEDFTLPFVGRVELGDLSYPATVAGIVAVMNIVNFIDGVDGLAAGICTIAAITFGVIALSLDRGPAGILAAITAGAALGYLRHGFHPASIFLGDSGSNLLGYLLAVIAVQGALKTNAVVALVFPLIVLAVPILDGSFVIAKRIKYRRPVYRADGSHFHHRFAGSASRSGGRCCTCTRGPACSPRWRSPSGSSRTPTTTATSTPAGRSCCSAFGALGDRREHLLVTCSRS